MPTDDKPDTSTEAVGEVANFLALHGDPMDAACVRALAAERDAERLRYGRAMARNSVLMAAMAELARNGEQAFAQEWIAKADAKAVSVRLEDFQVASRNAGPKR